jgi:hypothetical protein
MGEHAQNECAITHYDYLHYFVLLPLVLELLAVKTGMQIE